MGRGTFVRQDVRRRRKCRSNARPSYRQGKIIDLSVKVVPTPMASDDRCCRKASPKSRGGGYRPADGLSSSRRHGRASRGRRQWLAANGFPIAEADRVIVTAGGQHAMTARTPAPSPNPAMSCQRGDLSGLKRLADFLRLRLQGVPMDDFGVDPEAFETACRSLSPKVLTASATCRTRPASWCRRNVGAGRGRPRYGVKIVEDDVYGFLLEDRRRPLRPSRRNRPLFHQPVGKSMAGLRVGYLAIPMTEGGLHPGGALNHLDGDAMTAEIGADWIRNGIGRRLAEEHRLEAIERQKRAAGASRGCDPSPSRAAITSDAAADPGPADAFALEPGCAASPISPPAPSRSTRQAPAAIRICLCGPIERANLERGLQRHRRRRRTHPCSGMGVV